MNRIRFKCLIKDYERYNNIDLALYIPGFHNFCVYSIDCNSNLLGRGIKYG